MQPNPLEGIAAEIGTPVDRVESKIIRIVDSSSDFPSQLFADSLPGSLVFGLVLMAAGLLWPLRCIDTCTPTRRNWPV